VVSFPMVVSFSSRRVGRDFDADQFLRRMTAGPGAPLGVRHTVPFGQVQPAAVSAERAVIRLRRGGTEGFPTSCRA